MSLRNEILAGNVVLYSTNTRKLINEVREVFHIHCKNLVFDENCKIYKNVMNREIIEYTLTKSVKNNSIALIIDKIKESHENNILKTKKCVVIHNFQVVSPKCYKQFQTLFETVYNTVLFIFTSDRQNLFLQSFFLSLNIKYEVQDDEKWFNEEICKDCFKLIEYIYSCTVLDFSRIRKMLYELLFSYANFKIVLTSLQRCACMHKPEQFSTIVNNSAHIDKLQTTGNKDIIYLEHFILLLIDGDKKMNCKTT